MVSNRGVRHLAGVLSIAVIVAAGAAAGCGGPDETPDATSVTGFAWEALPSLPRATAGQAVGTSHGAVIVAGGTDFPSQQSQGGTKAWYDTVHVLQDGASEWMPSTSLSHPLAYAAAATAGDRLLLAGGADAERHYADVRALEWTDGATASADLPALPDPVAMAGAAVLGRTFYVVGGLGAPDSTAASAAVFALDLDAPDAAWHQLPLLPGPGRILPVVVAQADRLIVASGATLTVGADGQPAREYLSDVWAWIPDTDAGVSGGVWRRLADAPRPLAGAPVAPLGSSGVVVFGGDDGGHAGRLAELVDKHPGFSRDILLYEVESNSWRSLGAMPEGLVTAMAVQIDNGVFIAGGEDRPGHPSATVLLGRPE